MVKVRSHETELTGNVGQSSRTRRNSNHKDSFKRKNEATERKIIVWNKKKYIYERCNWEIEIEEKNIDDDTSSESEIEILDNEEVIKRGLSHLFPGVLAPINVKKEVKEEGQENNTEMIEERNIDYDIFSDIEILDSEEVIKRGLSHLFPDVLAPINVKKEVKEEGQEGKGSTEMTDKRNIGDNTSSNVEILDSNEVIKRGTSSVFVPSRTCAFDVSNARSDYRERVMEILKKPFDKVEYRELSEEVKFYLAYYPDLRKELAKYRYKKPTRITIMRGFFFWLKNVMHAGTFKPWKDSECLAVLPESGQD